MKARGFIIVFFVSIFFNHLSAQLKSGIIEYLVEFNVEKALTDLEKDNYDDFAKSIAIQKFKSSSDHEIRVIFDTQTSLSQEYVNLENDNSKEGINITRLLSGKDTKVYKDFSSKNTYLDKAGYSNVLISKSPFQWIVTSESKLINNKVCFKAVNERIIENSSGKQSDKVIAWFYKSEIQTGPYIFNDLPGIIMELTTNNGLVTYKLIKIKSKKGQSKMTIPKRNIINEKQANKIAKQNVKSLLNNN